MSKLHFLFLQGGDDPFFNRIANKLSSLGHKTTGLNLCVGDHIYWRGQNTVNYRGRLSNWPSFIGKFFDDHNVTDILLCGEQKVYQKIAINAAKQRNIRVTVTDFGYLRPDWIALERDGMSGNSLFPRDPQAIMNLASHVPKIDLVERYSNNFWTMTQRDMLYHLSNILLWWLFPHYRRPQNQYNLLAIYPIIGLRLLLSGQRQKHGQKKLVDLKAMNARYFIFPLQLENDYSIISYSPFNGLEEAIEQVICSFATNADAQTRLLIKEHPLNPKLKGWKKRIYQLANKVGIADRIDYVNGGNLDEMITSSVGMITVNSTSGIRALQLGCPVKTLGQAIYDVEGLSHQGPLDRYWNEAEKPDTELVDAFINAVAGTIQIRGVYYSEPGLSVAVDEAVKRLHTMTVGLPIKEYKESV